MRPILALLSVALLAAVSLAACGEIRGVSSSTSTNLEGAPGTAADPATGGQGNRTGGGGRR